MTLDRTVDIFVCDRENNPIPGAEISFTLDGAPAGTVSNANGRARIQVQDPTSVIAVRAIYDGETKDATLSQDQTAYTFRYDVSVGGTFMERHLALWVGLALFLLAIILGFVFGSPTTLQTRIILATLSLGGGAIATEISGMINVKLDLGKRLVIGASGALAIFVVLYLVVPA